VGLTGNDTFSPQEAGALRRLPYFQTAGLYTSVTEMGISLFLLLHRETGSFYSSPSHSRQKVF